MTTNMINPFTQHTLPQAGSVTRVSEYMKILQTPSDNQTGAPFRSTFPVICLVQWQNISIRCGSINDLHNIHLLYLKMKPFSKTGVKR